LGQFLVQIVTALKWEPEFRCVGIDSLDDFKAAVESANSVDPGSYAFRLPGDIDAKGTIASVPGFRSHTGEVKLRTVGVS